MKRIVVETRTSTAIQADAMIKDLKGDKSVKGFGRGFALAKAAMQA